MYQITVTQTRPNTSVPFFLFQTATLDEDFKTYMWETYISTNKQLMSDHVISDDQLTLTNTIVWDSRDSLDEFLNNPLVIEKLIKVRTEYYVANGIIEVVLNRKEI